MIILVGVILVVTGSILLYLQQKSFHKTARRIDRLEKDLAFLATELLTVCEEMQGLVQFFNDLPPESAIRAGGTQKFHMRLPDRMKLDFG